MCSKFIVKKENGTTFLIKFLFVFKFGMHHLHDDIKTLCVQADVIIIIVLCPNQ